MKINTALTTWWDADTGWIDVTINQVRREVSRAHRWTFLRRRGSVALASGDSYFDLGAECIDANEPMWIAATASNDPLEWIEESALDRIYLPGTTGKPRHVAIGTTNVPDFALGKRIRVGPTTDAAYTLRFRGYFYPADITNNNQEDVWMRDHPYMLMEGCMGHLRRLNDEYDKAVTHDALFRQMLREAIALDNQLGIPDYLYPESDGDAVPYNTSSGVNVYGR